jgi:hypothetical protein
MNPEKTIDGSKFWFFEGYLHRTDGPAVEYANGRKEWFFDGVEFTEQEWMNNVLFDKVSIKIV